MRHHWSKDELLELLTTADAMGDCWGYCSRCGVEISPVEPDATRAWCEGCGAEVAITSLAYARLQ